MKAKSKLYTGVGDRGTSTLFGSVRRIKKTDAVFEALGTLDELVSFLGWLRSRASKKMKPVLLDVQHAIFSIQAELAGADVHLSIEAVTVLEQLIEGIESKLPPPTGFVVPGETEYSALLDVVRAVSRRAERTVVAARKSSPVSLAYLNRLSSFLYALARQETVRSGITEQRPKYSK